MKSLQAKLLCIITSMITVSLVYGVQMFFEAQQERYIARRYEQANLTAGHLNAAAGWQAIHRGVGATILGSDGNPSAALVEKFRMLNEKASAERLQALQHAQQLMDILDEKGDLSSQLTEWEKRTTALEQAHQDVLKNSISQADWLKTATANIRQEFTIREVAFAPITLQEQVAYYNNVVRSNVAVLCEYAGIERALLGNAIAGGKQIESGTLEVLKQHRAIVEQAAGQILLLKQFSTAPQSLLNSIGIFESKFLEQYEELRQKVYLAGSSEKPDYPVDGSQWIKQATTAINSGLEVSNVVGQLANEASNNSIARANNRIIFTSVLIVFSLCLFVGAYFFVRARVIRPLTNILLRLQAGAYQVSAASGQLSTASQQLSQGAAKQASTLEDITSSLEEISSQTDLNADSARQMSDALSKIVDIARRNGESVQKANVISDEARASAENGVRAIDEIGSAMQEIHDGSNKITRTIEVIDEITHQTKMLATNAAIEAARAGDQGKGFAVVADEVSKLAESSKVSSREIADLIRSSIKLATDGSQLTVQGGKVLDVILSKSVETSELFNDIAVASESQNTQIHEVNSLSDSIFSASSEQAKGVDLVSKSVIELDHLAQSNSANAEQSAAASEQLNAQAEAFTEIVNELVNLVGQVRSKQNPVTRSKRSSRRNQQSSEPKPVPQVNMEDKLTAAFSQSTTDYEDFFSNDFKPRQSVQ